MDNGEQVTTAKGFRFLLLTQFFSTFAENTVFFALVGLTLERGIDQPDRYVSLLSTFFLTSYIILAPFVGTFADRHAKLRVMQLGSFIKLCGVIGLSLGFEPTICYFLFGVGEVMYSPAKYGILSELIPPGQRLVKGNGILEGISISAVLSGTVAGGWLADQSASIGIYGTIVFLAISLLFTLGIPHHPGQATLRYRDAFMQFRADLQLMIRDTQTRFALFGNGAFWMTGSVLRIAYLTWLPMVLEMTSKTQQSLLFVSSAIGVILGALTAHRFVAFGDVQRVIPFGFVVAGFAILSPWMMNVWLTVAVLFFIGFFGGLFVIPMNAFLQAEGKRRIGIGRLIAIQNMAENIIMVSGLIGFQLLAWIGIPIYFRMMAIGLFLIVVIFWLQRDMRINRFSNV